MKTFVRTLARVLWVVHFHSQFGNHHFLYLLATFERFTFPLDHYRSPPLTLVESSSSLDEIDRCMMCFDSDQQLHDKTIRFLS